MINYNNGNKLKCKLEGVKPVVGKAGSSATAKKYQTLFTYGASVLCAGELSNPMDIVLTELEPNK